jgi:SAM-dependent methyltransferase
LNQQPKPDFLGPQASSAFQEESVAEAYQFRPPYPSAVFDLLAALTTDEPRYVLDAGCGTGFLARYLAERVDRVDAVDISPAMIERGKRQPNGNHPYLRWIVGPIENAELYPPYSLITAGASVHWMDWHAIMPRFARLLTPHGFFAIVDIQELPLPWDDELWQLRHRYSTIPNFQYYDHVKGLEERALFRRVGSERTQPVPFTQSFEDYIESFHGRAAFSRDRMMPEAVAAFDAEIRKLVSRYCRETVELRLVAEVVWGNPLDRTHPSIRK